MLRSQCTLLEGLESRTLMSAATLTQDEANLAAAISQYNMDKMSSASVLAADKAAVKANKVQKDPAVDALTLTWKEAILTRDNTLLGDHTTLKMTTNDDRLAILGDRMNILNDKKDDNTAQLVIDKAQLNMDLTKLATDRKTLTDDLANDVITTKATIAGDHMAIIAKRLADGANPEAIMLRQQLVEDSIHWIDTLALDRKTIVADQLIVADDKHG